VGKKLKVIDSNKEVVEDAALLTLALSQLENYGVPPQAALAGLAKELSLPNVDFERVGNTIFITARGTGINKNKAVGRPINIDTGKNLVNNAVKFLQGEQSKGITHYSVNLREPKSLPLAKQVSAKMASLGVPSAIYAAKFKDSGTGYRIYFKLANTEEVSA